MRRRDCRAMLLVCLLAAGMAAGLAGCLGEAETGTTDQTGYAIDFAVDMTAYNDATVVASVECGAPNGDTLTYDPTEYPYSFEIAGYASGDTVWLRVRGTATCRTARGGIDVMVTERHDSAHTSARSTRPFARSTATCR